MTALDTLPSGEITPYRWDHGGGSEARYCHALRVRLSRAIDAEALTRLRVWVEDVPAAADTALAVRRRETELARPVGADEGLRAVLIRYTDGSGDLVLVAHRAVYSQSSLRALADALLGDVASPPVPGPSISDGATPPLVDLTPGWGLGDRLAGAASGTQTLAVDTGSDPAGWLAALAVVLRRYDQEEQPVAGALGLGEWGGASVWPVEIGSAATLGELTAEQPGQLVPVAVGLVFDLGGEGEYIPCLAPFFPLTITVGSGALRCDYLLRSVSHEIAAGFLRHLAEVHRQVVTSPWLPVADVDLLDASERDRVLGLGRSVPPGSAVPRRIPDVFADRVAERPDAIALSYEETSVSYRELDEWSDRLARGLRATGVRDGDRVGICEERSAELVALLLAVLKAGAVYVPMDPAYPSERLAYTVEDAGLSVLITSLTSIAVGEGTRVVTPAGLAELGSDAGPVTSAVTPDDPAYVIYTSGSTGRPKGVVVPHRNVISLLDATRLDFELGTGDVWTFFHSVAFDFSVWEIWGSLLTGGRLIVVPYWVSRSPGQFHDLMVTGGVTVLNQTPSAFVQLMEADRPRPADLAVRLVIFGGEPLDTRRLLPWFDRYPESRCRLVNMFGITETTVHVTAGTVDRRAALAGSRSVGRALPGWSVHVLDPAGRPVPPGVIGEIHVAGVGVATQYLGRPELTAERFVDNPFAGGRMYRSGDRGRLLPNGELEHLGRLDNQVKIRGFRIELGEIRSVLAESPGVVEAAVMLHNAEDAAAARIDAYVVLSSGSTSEVRRRVARLLPDYMLPATITALPELPLTANGKLDLANLPAPAVGTVATPPAQDTDALTEGLLDVWRQVLRAPVEMDDDWFELGGNSLFAVRMAAAMRERGLPSPHPRTLYLNPTVRGLADALRAASES